MCRKGLLKNIIIESFSNSWANANRQWREKTKPESARQQQLQETRKATLGSRLLNTLPGAASLQTDAQGWFDFCWYWLRMYFYRIGNVSLGAWQTSDHN